MQYYTHVEQVEKALSDYKKFNTLLNNSDMLKKHSEYTKSKSRNIKSWKQPKVDPANNTQAEVSKTHTRNNIYEPMPIELDFSEYTPEPEDGWFKTELAGTDKEEEEINRPPCRSIRDTNCRKQPKKSNGRSIQNDEKTVKVGAFNNFHTSENSVGRTIRDSKGRSIQIDNFDAIEVSKSLDKDYIELPSGSIKYVESTYNEYLDINTSRKAITESDYTFMICVLIWHISNKRTDIENKYLNIKKAYLKSTIKQPGLFNWCNRTLKSRIDLLKKLPIFDVIDRGKDGIDIKLNNGQLFQSKVDEKLYINISSNMQKYFLEKFRMGRETRAVNEYPALVERDLLSKQELVYISDNELDDIDVTAQEKGTYRSERDTFTLPRIQKLGRVTNGHITISKELRETIKWKDGSDTAIIDFGQAFVYLTIKALSEYQSGLDEPIADLSYIKKLYISDNFYEQLSGISKKDKKAYRKFKKDVLTVITWSAKRANNMEAFHRLQAVVPDFITLLFHYRRHKSQMDLLNYMHCSETLFWNRVCEITDKYLRYEYDGIMIKKQDTEEFMNVIEQVKEEMGFNALKVEVE